nr:unnamed protein product [Callosobruchus analis]
MKTRIKYRADAFSETFASLAKDNNHICVVWYEAIAGRRAEDVRHFPKEGVLKKKSKLTFPPQSEAPRGVSKAKKDTIIKALVPKMKYSQRPLWLELPEDASAKDFLEEGL